MTNTIKIAELINLLRTFIGDTQIVRAAREAADVMEQQAALIAALELQVSGERGQKEIWEARAKEWCERATADSAMAKEPVWCQSCGDGITAHDPGICGNCFAMKYRDASAEIFDRQRAGFDRCFEALGITDDRERDWSGLVIAIGDVAKDAERYRWLIKLFTGYDFDWMPTDENSNDGKSVAVFDVGREFRGGRDFTAALDAAIAASAEKGDAA